MSVNFLAFHFDNMTGGGKGTTPQSAPGWVGLCDENDGTGILFSQIFQDFQQFRRDQAKESFMDKKIVPAPS